MDGLLGILPTVLLGLLFVTSMLALCGTDRAQTALKTTMLMTVGLAVFAAIVLAWNMSAGPSFFPASLFWLEVGWGAALHVPLAAESAIWRLATFAVMGLVCAMLLLDERRETRPTRNGAAGHPHNAAGSAGLPAWVVGLSLACAAGAVFSVHLVELLLFWSVSAFVSEAFAGERQPKETTRGRLLVISRLGDAALLLAVLSMDAADLPFDRASLLDSERLAALTAREPALVSVAAWCLAGAALCRCAQFPVLLWLRPLHLQAESARRLVLRHCAVVMPTGVVLVFWAVPLLAAAPQAGLFLSVCGALTAVLAGWSACTASSPTGRLAGFSASLYGFVFLGAGVTALTGRPEGLRAAFQLHLGHNVLLAILLGGGSRLLAGEPTPSVAARDAKRLRVVVVAVAVVLSAGVLGQAELVALPWTSATLLERASRWDGPQRETPTLARPSSIPPASGSGETAEDDRLYAETPLGVSRMLRWLAAAAVVAVGLGAFAVTRFVLTLWPSQEAPKDARDGPRVPTDPDAWVEVEEPSVRRSDVRTAAVLSIGWLLLLPLIVAASADVAGRRWSIGVELMGATGWTDPFTLLLGVVPAALGAMAASALRETPLPGRLASLGESTIRLGRRLFYLPEVLPAVVDRPIGCLAALCVAVDRYVIGRLCGWAARLLIAPFRWLLRPIEETGSATSVVWLLVTLAALLASVFWPGG